jgi:hypothetical protein
MRCNERKESSDVILEGISPESKFTDNDSTCSIVKLRTFELMPPIMKLSDKSNRCSRYKIYRLVGRVPLMSFIERSRTARDEKLRNMLSEKLPDKL